MLKSIIQLTLILIPFLSIAQSETPQQASRVTSIVDSTHENNMVLMQSFNINVPLDSVWNAFTTKKGWESWAVAIAEVDLKINGLIQTSYNKDATIGDSTTITLNILNYIPRKMITLQAELTKNFPAFMKADEKNLSNMILFEELSPFETRVISYGIGYRNNEKYMSLLKFFIQGNEQSYLNLISYLETGKPSVNY